MYDIIRKKRYGEELTDPEISYFIRGYTDGSISDYQASALCMAVCFVGMTERETVTLTQCMASSGDTIDLGRFGDLSVDKHSTGGVGDKTSLIVAPIVASLGGKVTKMSGRGLGHTGGTVDKLESIPGFRTVLSEDEFINQIENVGIAVIGQSSNLTPADKKLYALRDVTATVDSIPLITSSIMSKKLAAGSHSIVLDVKVGSGAFMKTEAEAVTLAENMVRIGKKCGRKMAALITNMDVPLGNNVGNSLEIVEAVSVLKGEEKGDLYRVCVALASNMVSLVKNITVTSAQRLVKDAISSGRAFEKMKEWIAAQGGDVSYIEDADKFPKAGYIVPVVSGLSGYVCRMDTEKIGSAAARLGAGRTSKDDEIDHSAGIVIKKKKGDYVKAGDVLCILHTSSKKLAEEAEALYLSAIELGSEKPEKSKTVYRTVR